ncbi:hypothetical protein ACTXT7_006918 [Hymenolepis weldensis]
MFPKTLRMTDEDLGTKELEFIGSALATVTFPTRCGKAILDQSTESVELVGMYSQQFIKIGAINLGQQKTV